MHGLVYLVRRRLRATVEMAIYFFFNLRELASTLISPLLKVVKSLPLTEY